ncbi:hypothetical protein WA026_020181 [Henosepilachna vigintioctopunctata]|uniref:Sorting nexin-14-like n=1 Tax=Henosepilachna vigintioctopunctata TaxID=420089 RepID=A0AAW1UA59_9CUCU
MFLKDGIEIICILKNEKATKFIAILVVLICIMFSFFSSCILAVVLLSFYFGGLLVCYAFIQYKGSTTNTLLQCLVGFCKGRSKTSKKVTHSCSICLDLSCKRNHDDTNSSPWEGLLIDEKLNNAIEKFCDTLLQNFVLCWYDNLSNDENFINELKYSLKYSMSAIAKRALEIDLATILSEKILPCAVRHIDDYIYMEQIAKLKNSTIQDVAVEFLGKRLHGASSNRKNELVYLREVTSSLLPFVLPNKYLICSNYFTLFREIVAGWVLLPFMDVVSDPNIINSLIILGSNYKLKPKMWKNSVGKKEFLENFGCISHEKKSLFFKDLNEIKEDTELLYTFMQFLKCEGHVHLLQFCLDVDEFNNKLMTSDLSRRTLEELYKEALKLNDEFISKYGINYVKCSEEISDHLRELLKDGILSIAKIKVSGPLIKAYKEVFDNLEHHWLPIFFQSNEFYSYLCGPKVTPYYTKTSVNKNRKNEYASFAPNSKLGSLGLIKSALKNCAPVEGSIFYPEKQFVQNGSEIEIPVCYSLIRDISMWEVSISSYVSLNKVIHFHVSVKRPNPVTSEMETERVVLRKDQDFYSLKAKLVEFHGEYEICDSPLPARKAGSDIGARMIGYENFIRKLLKNSSLRGSDLIHMFLTTEEDFSIYITSCGVPVQDIGNIYQSVAQKLRKEKGQHLDDFMNIFISSIGKDKTGRFATTEMGDEVDPSKTATEHFPVPKTYRNVTFNDNFGVTCCKVNKASTRAVNPVNFMECLLYIGKHIFVLPTAVMRLYVAICSLISETVDSIWHVFIRRQISYVLSPQSLEYLVTFLTEVLFNDPSNMPSELELESRKKSVIEIFNNMPGRLPYTMLGQNFFSGLKRLWEITQHPHYNKHLTYQMLDIIFMELFPSFNRVQEKLEM